MSIWMSKGASVDTYVRPEGELGTAYSDFKVAHRGGEPSPLYPRRRQSLPLKIRGNKGVMNNGTRKTPLAPFAAAPSSGSWCRTVALTSAPDANLSVPGL